MPGKYADIFGKPGEGVHRYRFAGLAVVDVIATLIAAILTARFLDRDIWITIAIFFIIGIAMHWLFQVNTRLNVALGLGSD